MEVGKPIDEKKMPAPAKSGHYKHLALYEQIMKLDDGKVLPITLETEEKAKKFGVAIQHSNFAPFRSFVRGKVVFVRLRNTEDDKQREHIKKLREMAKKKKEGV